MTRTNRFNYFVLIFTALTLAACASKPKEEPVAEPTPAAAVAEQQAAPAPVVAQEAAPAPVEQAAQPAPKKRVVKRVKKPAPVAAPEPVKEEPVVEPAPVAVPEPVKEEPVVAPVQQVAEPGFLEKYWLWLLGLIVGLVAVVWVAKKKE
jgi:hypothetical protein